MLAPLRWAANRRLAAMTVAELTIRKGEPCDAAAFADIGAATFIETFAHLYREEDLSAFLAKSHSVAGYEKLLADPDWTLWLAETGEGAAAGYAAVGPCGLPVPEMPEKSGELARLYMRGAYHGYGIGSRLLDLALADLRARFDHVYVSVYAENHGAQRLYARHGFKKVHDYFYMVGEHADPEWIMKLR